MIALILPIAAICFAAFAVRKAVASSSTTHDDDDDTFYKTDDYLQDSDMEAGSSSSAETNQLGIELTENAPVVSDITEWLSDASERLCITKQPTIQSIEGHPRTSTFLTFESDNVEFRLWLAGADYLGPFPRLVKVTDSKSSDTGIAIERSSVSLERAIFELKK